MIVDPAPEELIRAVVRDLRGEVKAAVADSPVSATVDVMVSILDVVANQLEHRQRMMSEEVLAIRMVVDQVAQQYPEFAVGAPTASAAQPLSPAEHTALTDDYARLSDVLARLGELQWTMPDGPIRQAIAALFAQRLAHETTILGGQFRAAGRDS
ncbi:MAG: hypothetical protein EPO13_09440 [Actinomycetota bacterium]|nr:MAG: hypothetical protein EPO13_09440 [Actinomycetota bacterium]